MRLTIQHLHPNGIRDEFNYPQRSLNPKNPILETKQTIGELPDIGYSHDIFLENMWINHSKVSIKERLKFKFNYDFPMVLLQFVLSSNGIQEKISKEPKTHLYEAKKQSTLFSEALNGVHEHFASDYVELLRIHLKPDFFVQILPDTVFFEPYRRKIAQKEFFRLSDTDMPISPAMLVLLKGIVEIKSKGAYKKWILEAKVIELVSLQLEQYELHCRPLVLGQRNKHKDSGRMFLAQEIILKHLQSPLSIPELARTIGTNECYLKRSFKEVFGTTVFGYIHSARMEQAKELLENEKGNIHQIAEMVGYKNANHFSQAFKKHFGTQPTKWLNSRHAG